MTSAWLSFSDLQRPDFLGYWLHVWGTAHDLQVKLGCMNSAARTDACKERSTPPPSCHSHQSSRQACASGSCHSLITANSSSLSASKDWFIKLGGCIGSLISNIMLFATEGAGNLVHQCPRSSREDPSVCSVSEVLRVTEQSNSSPGGAFSISPLAHKWVSEVYCWSVDQTKAGGRGWG